VAKSSLTHNSDAVCLSVCLTMAGISDYLATDDLTILLALIAATTFLLNNLYRPQPLVHPILLGRQSDVGRARNPGESALYRNYGTGLMGRVGIHFIHVLRCPTHLFAYSFPLAPAKRSLLLWTSSSQTLKLRALFGLQRFEFLCLCGFFLPNSHDRQRIPVFRIVLLPSALVLFVLPA